MNKSSKRTIIERDTITPRASGVKDLNSKLDITTFDNFKQNLKSFTKNISSGSWMDESPLKKVTVTHNLNSQNVSITVRTSEGEEFVAYKVVDSNEIIIYNDRAVSCDVTVFKAMNV